MNMLAARLYGKDDLRVEQVPVPDITDGELLIKVKAAAICGTDVRMWKNGAKGVDEQHPLVLCHEFSGIIERVAGGSAGADSTAAGFTPGRRVSIAPNLGCGLCGNCVSGKGHHCKTLTALGVHIDGGFAEYVRIPAAAVRLGNVTPLGDGVSFAAAAANEAFSCVYNASERYQVRPGDTVVIIGAGAIGMMHAALAKMNGAAQVILNDLSQERLAECAKIFPWLTIVDGGLPQAVAQKTNGAMADVVITACSAAPAQQAAFALAGLDARVNFFGGLPHGKEMVALDTNLIHYKQLLVSGTTRASLSHYRQTLRFMEAGMVDLDALVTHRYSLADIQTAMNNAACAVGLKHVIVFE